MRGRLRQTQVGRLSPRMVCIIEALASDWRRPDEVSAEIETLARKAIFGAWLGMAPKQESAPPRQDLEAGLRF